MDVSPTVRHSVSFANAKS